MVSSCVNLLRTPEHWLTSSMFSLSGEPPPCSFPQEFGLKERAFPSPLPFPPARWSPTPLAFRRVSAFSDGRSFFSFPPLHLLRNETCRDTELRLMKGFLAISSERFASRVSPPSRNKLAGLGLSPPMCLRILKLRNKLRSRSSHRNHLSLAPASPPPMHGHAAPETHSFPLSLRSNTRTPPSLLQRSDADIGRITSPDCFAIVAC